MFARFPRRVIAAALLASLAIAGCGTAAPPTAGQPTGAPALPTQAATSQPAAQPTAAPQPTAAAQPTAGQAVRQPAFSLDPREGLAGTQITINGWDFAPGGDVAVRLGNPQPLGEALAAARADTAGRLSVSFALPANLPSGDPVPAGDLRVVLMDANTNQALASAPFRYHTLGGPTRPEAQQVVASFLAAYGRPEAAAFLASDLSRQVSDGRPIHQVVGLPEQGWDSYTTGAPLDRPSEVLFVPATLVQGGQRSHYEFTMVVERGEWKINGNSLIGRDTAFEPASRAPDRWEALNIATVARRHLEQEFPGRPIVAGALAVAGDFAVAAALPAGFEWRTLYMHAMPGAGFVVVLDSVAATSEELRARGLPTTLLQHGEEAAVAQAIMFHTNTPEYGGASGEIAVEGIDGGYAKATLQRAPGDELTIYLRQYEGSWLWLIDGQLFAPELLDEHGIPASLR